MTTDFQQIWQNHDQQLNQTIVINRTQLEEITRLKVKSALTKASPVKIFAVVFGIFWVIFIDSLIVGMFSPEWIFFEIAAIIHSAITTLAIGVYIYHQVLISRIDNSHSIAEVQEKLSSLTRSSLWINRLLFVQLPLFTVFQINLGMFANPQIGWWIFQISITILFTLAGFWFFFNIKAENRNKKWFKVLFGSVEWTSLDKAEQLLQQVDELKTDSEK